MQYIDIDHPEWEKMWNEVANYSMNSGDPLCVNDANRSWEYMGSTPDHHHLRHACHPVTNKPEYMYIERSAVVLRWASAQA